MLSIENHAAYVMLRDTICTPAHHMALRCCASGALQLRWEVAVVQAEHNVSPHMAYLRKTSISYAAYKRQRGRWRCLDLQRMQNFRHVLHTEPKTVPVVWKASSTIPSSSSEAAKWNTEKTFFQPDLILWACEWTICATQRTTMSRMVADLQNLKKKSTRWQWISNWRCNHFRESLSQNVCRKIEELWVVSDVTRLQALQTITFKMT